ncbi:MAG: hypothetical protein K1X89_14925 [Myxococcaceae bacterium]|nr:hypothetical protein [Myxococcaceae bacterium]
MSKVARSSGGNPYSIDLTPEQQQQLQGLDPNDRARMELQMREQNKTELVSFLSNILKMKHDAAMAVIGNMR